MQTLLKQDYTTRDYMLDSNGKLRGWICRWSFALYKEKEGEAYRYEASVETAPGEFYTCKRDIQAAELVELTRNIKRLYKAPLFTHTGGPQAHKPA